MSSPGKLSSDGVVHAWTPCEPAHSLRATGVKYFKSICGKTEAQATIHFFYISATFCVPCFTNKGRPKR